MPLFKTITVHPDTTVLIWKVTESISDLKHDVVLSENSLDRLSKMKSEVHIKGFLSIRHLLKIAGYTDTDLYYNSLGKPFLIDQKKISITHSYNFSAIIISNRSIGIDIEMQRDKILRIASKFTPITHYTTLANTEARVRKLTIVWCIKEAIYKQYGTAGLSFLNHIDVNDFELSNTIATASVTYNNQKSLFKVAFFEFEGFTCAYSLEKQ